ncbi:MAG TPA: IspD/TarI family cytidylyltransferase [Catalimonadaceae bacterium]|nr:IspD/TarI family cytidylyltransferase [Catalimonadaceae bacterium]HPI10277.1 IspD/TarI family cytidylyltransferase [Catalimonadaceae bacterium]
MDEEKRVAIIVAAGSGSRMGSALPKQFHELAGIPLAIHPGLKFRQFDPTIELVYVISIGSAQIWENLLQTYFPTGGWRLCMGGKTRYESVQNGVNSITNPDAWVAIHDGARPFIEKVQLNEAFLQAKQLGNAVFAAPAKDSLRQTLDDGTSRFVDRSQYYCVQTPQIFRQRDLLPVYQQAPDALFTDDATVMELAGYRIHLFPGPYENIKVTTPEDWILAERILEKTGRPESHL